MDKDLVIIGSNISVEAAVSEAVSGVSMAEEIARLEAEIGGSKHDYNEPTPARTVAFSKLMQLAHRVNRRSTWRTFTTGCKCQSCVDARKRA